MHILYLYNLDFLYIKQNDEAISFKKNNFV